MDCIDCKHIDEPGQESCFSCINQSKFESRNVVPKNTEDPLLEALKLIRETCKKQELCKTCPMRKADNNCPFLKGFGKRPDHWKFKGEEEDEPVRIFL